MQRRHHYEQALEDYLRRRRVPYVAVDEARKALLPEGASLRVLDPAELTPEGEPAGRALKSFDMVIYAGSALDGSGGTTRDNLLIEVKGRRIGARASRRTRPLDPDRPFGRPATRLESWCTEEDVWSLRVWQALFGPGFAATLVFLYWCDEQPPAALFEEMFDFRGRWYAIRAARVDAYAGLMRPRSARWRTVHVAQREFDRISGPLLPKAGELTPSA